MNKARIEKGYDLLKNWWETVDLTNYEKSILNEEIISFNQKLFRLKEKILKVGVFGKSGVGKSSVLNKLIKKNYFNTDILHGSTKKITSKEFRFDEGNINTLEFVDSPGFDNCNQDSPIEDYKNILDLDLILFIVSGDLNRSEFDSLNSLLEKGKQIIIIFNKADNWEASEIKNIIQNIHQKFPQKIHLPIIVNSERNLAEKNKSNLNKYIFNEIKKSGEELLIINTFQLADELSTKIKETRMKRRKKEVQSTIGKFATLKASSVALNPLLFFDIAGGVILDTALIKELSDIYGLKIKAQSAKIIFQTISVNNFFICAAQIGINTSLTILRKISLFAAPFTNGLSLLPYGPVAVLQAAIAVQATKSIGKLAANEIMKKSTINDMDPIKIINQISSLKPDLLCSSRNLSYNRQIKNDLSIFIP